MTNTLEIPSCVNAVSPISTVSGRYGFIPSNEVISAFDKEGWKLTQASAVKVRKPDRQGYQKHLLRFVHHSQAHVQTGHRMETVFINSHDKTSGVVLGSGVFRFVCSNGLMVADSTIQGFKLYHTGLTMDRVITCAHDLLQQQGKVAETIDRWKETKLDRDHSLELARAGLELRWGADPTKYPISAEVLLTPRRQDDVEDTLWNVFNRVQENTINGGLLDRTRTRDNGRSFRLTRNIKSITANHDINIGLWDTANELALAY